jgi:predicted metalloprotease with PDZ domain
MNRLRILVLVAALAALGWPAPPARADHLGVTVKQRQGGVEVTSVTPRSLAAQLTLAPKDVIENVNGMDIRTDAQLADALGPKNPSLVIRILRGGERKTIHAEVFWPRKEGSKDKADPPDKKKGNRSVALGNWPKLDTVKAQQEPFLVGEGRHWPLRATLTGRFRSIFTIG